MKRISSFLKKIFNSNTGVILLFRSTNEYSTVEGGLTHDFNN